MPRFKPPFPASFGLYGKPTTINNTETFAAVPWIINNGGEAFLALGRQNNGGTKIFSVSGDVARPGNYEIKLGTPFAQLLDMAGGMRGGAQAQGVHPRRLVDAGAARRGHAATDMDYDSIAKAGSMLGSGAVILMDDTRCMVRSLLRLSYFYFEESCGQCTPCREGTGWLWRIVDRIEHGKGKNEDLDLLLSVSDNIAGRTICALGDAAALPVKSFIKHFRDEFQYHIDHKQCLVPALCLTVRPRQLRVRAMLTLEVDGKSVQVPNGSTVMDAAHKLDIYVPHFCWHKKLTIAANCRMCLVQVEKAPKPQPACATPAAEGMKVWTHSDAAVTAQKGVMEFLLINHPLDCPICDQGGECQLQDLAVGYGASSSRYDEPKRVVLNKNLGPLIATDMTRCIHCTRCVRFGQEIAGVMELGMANRGEYRGDHDLRRPHRRLRAVRQHDRPVPGRRADIEAVPLHGADLGARAAKIGVAARRSGQQPRRSGQERQSHARRAAGKRAGQRMLAVGQGPVFLRGAQFAGPADASIAAA